MSNQQLDNITVIDTASWILQMAPSALDTVGWAIGRASIRPVKKLSVGLLVVTI